VQGKRDAQLTRNKTNLSVELGFFFDRNLIAPTTASKLFNPTFDWHQRFQ
jgi:hypothetical protein